MKLLSSIGPTGLLLVLILLLSITGITHAASTTNDSYVCGGSIEQKVWTLWDETVKKHVSDQLLEIDFLAHGDTYALYSFQTFVHNLAVWPRDVKGVNESTRLSL
jgi:hypothetical protein